MLATPRGIRQIGNSGTEAAPVFLKIAERRRNRRFWTSDPQTRRLARLARRRPERSDSVAKILVLHGPNLNLLGSREPETYGHTTLAQIDADLVRLAGEAGHELASFQSNAE